MLLDLKEHSKTAGLTINFKKTNIMSNRQNRDTICRWVHLLGPAGYTAVQRNQKEASIEGLLGTQIYSPGQVSKQKKLTRCSWHMNLARSSICEPNWVTTKHKNTIKVCQKKMEGQSLNTQLQEWSMLKSAAKQAPRTKWKLVRHVGTTMWDPYRDRPTLAD